MTGAHGALPHPPQPFEVLDARSVEPILQAADDELKVLQLELAELDEELGLARLRAQADGIDPGAVAIAAGRLEELVRAMRDDATAQAAAIGARADAAAAAVLERARAQAARLRGEVPPTVPLAVSVPVPPSVPAPVPPAIPAAAGWAVPPGWAPAPAGWMPVPVAAPTAPSPVEAPRAPYSKAVGLLQVVSWSILVAVVLIVLLAWFA